MSYDHGNNIRKGGYNRSNGVSALIDTCQCRGMAMLNRSYGGVEALKLGPLAAT